MIIQCPKCNKTFKTDISQTIDENGEVYQCPYCKYKIRYAEK